MITPKWLRKGARIEVLTENEWWEAVAGTIKQNFVRISYVGGAEDEDEWIDINSERIREPQGEPEVVEGGNPTALAQDVPGGISSHTSSKTNKGGGRSSKNSKNVADEKTQNLLGPGWQKIAIDERGHYTYISPDGQTFSNLSAAQEHATRAGNNQGDAKRNKRKKQDRNSADGACSRDDTLVEPPLDAAPTRDKTARPFHKSYLREVEAVWHHTKFTKVCNAAVKAGYLPNDDGDASQSTEYLAQLIGTVQEAMDIHLGRDAHPKKRQIMEKIPHYIFRQWESDGPLLLIVRVVVEYMHTENIRSLEQLQQLLWHDQGEVFSHMNLLLNIRDALIEASFYVRPVVYISPALERAQDGKGRSRKSGSDSSAEDCRVWAEALRAQVTELEEEATHVIIEDTEDMAETDDFFCRQVDKHHPQKKGLQELDLANVHWWFFPDSYDDWIPQVEVNGEDTQEPRKAKWVVCVRWLRDSYKFNEWMNELDYEADDYVGYGSKCHSKRWSAEEDEALWQAYNDFGRTMNKESIEAMRKRPGLAARSATSIRDHLRLLVNKEKQRFLQEARGDVANEDSSSSKMKKSQVKEGGGAGEGAESAGAAKKGAAQKMEVKKPDLKMEVKKPNFKRVLSVNHECWGDEADLKASLAADPRIYEWGLPLCKEDVDNEVDVQQKHRRQQQEAANAESAAKSAGGGGSWMSAPVQVKDVPGASMPLVLPGKASWFDSEAVHELEKTALPEYFDGKHAAQGKTEATYRWYRQAILSLWHLHVAGHVARLFKFKNRDGDEEDKDESAAGSKRRAGGAGDRRRRHKRQTSRGAPGRGKAVEEDAEEDEEDVEEEEEEAFAFQWPAAMPVSVCLQSISGQSSDILRIFDFLESYSIINPAAAAEHEVGGVWTERDILALRAAFRRHGAQWSSVAADVGRANAPEECAVVMAAMVLRGSPLQRLASLHAERIQRSLHNDLGAHVGAAERAKTAAVLGQASVVHRGIGLQSAAAAVDAVMQHSMGEMERAKKSVDKADKGSVPGARVVRQEMSELDMEQLQKKACKASILAKLSLRSSLLARRETLDMRRLMAEAVELQMERIQSKAAELLGNQLLLYTLSMAE